MEPIYLDHNATTPLLPDVAAAMTAAQTTAYANPSSPHAEGRRAKQALEDAREGLAELLGAKLSGPAADRLIFTSGGTEANNLALHCLCTGQTQPVSLVTSLLEHPSVVACAKHLAATARVQLEWAAIAADGRISLPAVANILQRAAQGDIPRIAALSVMLGHHETGVLQPVAEIAQLCRAQQIPIHTDAVQVAGKTAVHFRELGVAALSLAPHKFHGPRGIGAVLLRHDVPMRPLLFGGPQQDQLRPGTEPVVLAVGMHAALKAWHEQQTQRVNVLQTCRDRFEELVLAELPDVVVHGRTATRLPHTSFLAFPGADRQTLLLALDLAGVCCSAGAACQSGASEPSPTLTAMGLPPELINGSLRFSFGLTNTVAEAERAAAAVVRIVRKQQVR